MGGSTSSPCSLSVSERLQSHPCSFPEHCCSSATSSAGMQGRAKKIIKEQQKFNTVLFACFILDVLECLSKLSILFQKDNVTLTLAKDGLEHTLHFSLQPC